MSSLPSYPLSNPSQETVVSTAMHLTRWGRSGPAVVMVHGSAQGSQIGGDLHFSHQRQLGEHGWQVIVPDRPGHGRSLDPGRPDDAPADGALVADLIARTPDGSAHLVGHSFGGCVALAAAAQHPERVRSLTIIEPAMAALAADLPVVRGFIFQIVKVLFLSFSATARIQRFVKLVNIPPEIRMKLPNKKLLQQQLAAVKQAGIPVLVVSGGWSPAFEAISDRVAQVVGGRRRVIASPHHFPQQVSDEFNQTLAAFMTESDAARR
jgi:pimeloyl-ACP methyl ester carboxylesterase